MGVGPVPRRRPHHFPESPSRGLAGSQLRTRPQRRSRDLKPSVSQPFPNTSSSLRDKRQAARRRGHREVVPSASQGCWPSQDTGNLVLLEDSLGLEESAQSGRARPWGPILALLCPQASRFSLSLFSLGKCSRSFLGLRGHGGD